MNIDVRKIIFVVLFVLLTLILPMIILLIFFDATTQFSAYVVVYGLIIFGVLGYVVSCVKNMEGELNKALEEIKMQNAAIAHKISGGETANLTANIEKVVSAAKVSLNPEEPLVVRKSVKEELKKSDDGFDDFK